MVTHLKYCMRSAYDEGIESLPQQDMIDLGISYQCATPQSIADQWWFWNCENIPDPLPKRLAVLDIEDPHKFIGYGLAQIDADKIKSYKSIIKGEKMSDQKCMNCKGQDIFEGECLSCGYEAESSVQFVTKNFPDVDGIAVGDITNVSIPHIDGTLPILEAEAEQPSKRIRGSFRGVSFVVDSIKRDSRLVDVPPELVTGHGLETQPKSDKPSLCEHKAEFKCTASLGKPMSKCRFFAPRGKLYWLCTSRGDMEFECLNPTAKTEALSKQVAIVEELSARIAELEAKWTGGNLEAHGILKVVYELTRDREWDGSITRMDNLSGLLDKAADKFGWDKKDENE